MASTNKTPNYNLPQWSESDKIEFSPDVNNAFSAIDAGMKANAANIGLLNFYNVDSAQGDWKVTLDNIFASLPVRKTILIGMQTTTTMVSGYGARLNAGTGVFSIIDINSTLLTVATRTTGIGWTYATK